MLKIKDNVDLKELEKFGFELKTDDFNGEKLVTGGLTIWDIDREVWGTNLDLLFDLIQAGLVEKVGGDNE